MALGPDFLILRSDEEDKAFREKKTDHCPAPSTDGAPVRGGAALADAGTAQVQVTLVQEGSKSKAKASGTSAARLHAWNVCAGLLMLRPEGLTPDQGCHAEAYLVHACAATSTELAYASMRRTCALSVRTRALPATGE